MAPFPGVWRPFPFCIQSCENRRQPRRLWILWLRHYRPDAGQSRHLKKDARLLLRLLVALGSKRLFLTHASRRAFHAAAEGAGVECHPLSSRKETPRHGDFVLIEGNSCDVQSISELLGNGVAVMTIDSPDRLTDCIENGISRGVIFTGTRIVLGVPRKEMALVRHSMRF